MTDWTEIEQARAKAHAKHGENSIEGITADDPRWLSILVEEGGETSEATLLAWNALLQARIGRVAHEQTYDAAGSLRAEIVDVLAVASAWLDALDKQSCICAPASPSSDGPNIDCPVHGMWPCRKDVAGTIPSWAGEDQVDPCQCVLYAGHDGAHECEHGRHG